MVVGRRYCRLKKRLPFLLKLDPASGAIESLSILEAETKSYDDVVDDHFLSQYVISRETYNYYTVQSDYDKTLLMVKAQPLRNMMRCLQGIMRWIKNIKTHLN